MPWKGTCDTTVPPFHHDRVLLTLQPTTGILTRVGKALDALGSIFLFCCVCTPHPVPVGTVDGGCSKYTRPRCGGGGVG